MKDLFLDKIYQGFEAYNRIPEILYQYNKRELVYQYKKVKLYHYGSRTKKSSLPPILIVFATVNRPEILDLFPENSFISELLQKGMDVYLLDWGYPTSVDKNLSFNDYICSLNECVEFIRNVNQKKKINLLGVCQGGVFCLCYAALYRHIKNLVLISTPIDFHTSDNALAGLINKIDVNAWEENIPGSWLNQFFMSIQPFSLLKNKYLRFLDNIENDVETKKFLKIEKWLHDTPDQTALAFKEFIYHFYQQNKLIKNEIKIDGEIVNLTKLSLPILNIIAAYDVIIPPSASHVLHQYIDKKHYTEQIYPSGHIGILVSEKSKSKVVDNMVTWLKGSDPKKLFATKFS